MTVHELPEQAALLAVVSIRRRGDGSICVVLEHMPKHVIESIGETPSARMIELADWLCDATDDAIEQAEKLIEGAATEAEGGSLYG